MIPIQRSCDVENLQDFTRYYLGSWVGWHGSDSTFIQPAYIGHAITADTAHVKFMSKNADGRFLVGGNTLVSWSEINKHIDFGVPDIGMIADGPTVRFCSYSTPRAAKKGFRPRDVKSLSFNNWEIRKKYVEGPQDRWDWVWFAFNPEYQGLERAENTLLNGEAVGLGLSKTLAIYSHPKFKNSLLAYKRWTIGHVVSPYLLNIKREYADYEEDIARQTGAEVIVG